MSAVSAPLLLRARLRGGVVEGLAIVSPRADPSPVFIGLAPEEAAVLAGRLFSLCPVSQSLAARAAGEAALGVGIDVARRRNWALGLLCERLGEMLRASLLDGRARRPNRKTWRACATRSGSCAPAGNRRRDPARSARRDAGARARAANEKKFFRPPDRRGARRRGHLVE